MFQPSKAVINGKFSEESNAQIVSIYSPSFQYGLNIFEGIRVYNNSSLLEPFLLDKHISRLLRSWKLLGLGVAPSRKTIKEDIYKLLKSNEDNQNLYIKYIVGYLNQGSWNTFECPDRICFYYPSESIFEKDKIRKAKGSISSIKRINSNSLAANIKCGANYINSRLAYMDVQQNKKSKIVPIMLDDNGNIAESSGSSLFIIKGNQVVTPFLSSGILPSITREYLLQEISNSLKEISFREANISRWDLFDADKVFLVGTSVEILELTEIDLFTYKDENIVLNKIYMHFKKNIFK